MAIATLMLCAHGQVNRAPLAKVNGIEVTYLCLGDGTQSKYYTDSTDRGAILQGDTIHTIINYAKGTYTTCDNPPRPIPRTAKPRKGDQMIDMLGWRCYVKEQGKYCIYYTFEPGFAATAAPWIAAPQNGAVLLISDLKSGDILYTATSVSQIH